MYISKLSLRNYRNFKNSSLKFVKGVNTIIGENGCGKTNIMTALRVLLDGTLPRTYRFNETDFNRTLQPWQGHWIILQIFFDELDHGDEAQALAIHAVGNVDGLDHTKGACCAMFRPKYDVRKQLWELSERPDKNEIMLQELLQNITTDDYELYFTSRSSADFSVDENYRTYIGDFDEIVFPNPLNEHNEIYGSRFNMWNFTGEVSCTFIKALRDVEADLRSYKDNPLINLLRGKERSIEIGTKNDIVRRVNELNEQISGLDEVQEVASGIAGTVRSSVGETYAPSVSIKSELPEDMEKLMQSLKLFVGDSADDPYQGKIWELSLGGANLIYLSTKLLEYEKVRAQDKVANFLLIEEPEAHIHTHIQKTLFQKIPEGKTQVIISTHSTHISSVSKISSVNILSKQPNYAQVYAPSVGLTPDEIVRIERYLDAVRSNLLFAKGVILVEGDAEQILIPTMFKAVFGLSLDEVGLTMVNIGSTGFKNLATLFHSERVRKHCAILTDEDVSIVPLPENPVDDTIYQKDCRNSEASGRERKADLDEFAVANDFVKVFYARNTFEVQFLLSGNQLAVCNVIEKIYSRQADINGSKEKINDEDVSAASVEILRLAKKVGKGWFALSLAGQMNLMTCFPEYILKAISFAMPHFNLGILKAMAVRRYSEMKRIAAGLDDVDYQALLESIEACLSIGEVHAVLDEHLPEDQLTLLVNLKYGPVPARA